MEQKRLVTSVLVLMFSCMNLCNIYADEADINIQYVGHHGTHSEYYPPADMPEVYYDSDNQEIIVVADGFAAYYDVNIISQSTLLAVISTQIDGYGDTIDVSSLPDGDYTIVIVSSNNNEFEGQFTNY